MSISSAASSIDLVELVPLDSTSWRVCDARYADGGSRYILGYLRETGGEFEMMWMRPRPGVCYRYATFDDALRAIRLRVHHLR